MTLTTQWRFDPLGREWIMGESAGSPEDIRVFALTPAQVLRKGELFRSQVEMLYVDAMMLDGAINPSAMTEELFTFTPEDHAQAVKEQEERQQEADDDEAENEESEQTAPVVHKNLFLCVYFQADAHPQKHLVGFARVARDPKEQKIVSSSMLVMAFLGDETQDAVLRALFEATHETGAGMAHTLLAEQRAAAETEQESAPALPTSVSFVCSTIGLVDSVSTLLTVSGFSGETSKNDDDEADGSRTVAKEITFQHA
ncbi:hypothetical protein FI667_g298, partial [Globisporangium splendens]